MAIGLDPAELGDGFRDPLASHARSESSTGTDRAYSQTRLSMLKRKSSLNLASLYFW
jgi:hypothetical protein